MFKKKWTLEKQTSPLKKWVQNRPFVKHNLKITDIVEKQIDSTPHLRFQIYKKFSNLDKLKKMAQNWQLVKHNFKKKWPFEIKTSIHISVATDDSKTMKIVEFGQTEKISSKLTIGQA